MSTTSPAVRVGGPFYEDLSVGAVFDTAPSLTLTDAHAVAHQALLGDRLRLALDAGLSARVLGPGASFAHPGLVCDVAIGQSTQVTGRVVANLFYRGLTLARAVRIGDTLSTRTEVVALRDNRAKPGRAPTGVAVLHMTTVDQAGRPVLDFHRAAMLPMRDEAARPGHADATEVISAELDPAALAAAVGWFDLEAYREGVPGAHADPLEPGTRFTLESGDTVTGATELVRLTLNLAAAHSDPTAGGRGRRLVYGGHTIGIAAAQLTRALPDLVTIVAWRACDHVGPVFEGDVLSSEITVEAVHPVGGGALVDLRVLTSAHRAADLDGETVDVLDWRLVGVMA
jgi:acyl dehydratase